MNTIPTKDGNVDLEDSSVSAVRREGDVVVISFDAGRLWIGADRFEVADLDVELWGVKREAVTFYGAEAVTLAVNGAAVPLYVVEVVEYSSGVLELQGLRENEPWCVWRIEGSGVTLSWHGMSRNAL
jgi:hypothetical protein